MGERIGILKVTKLFSHFALFFDLQYKLISNHHILYNYEMIVEGKYTLELHLFSRTKTDFGNCYHTDIRNLSKYKLPTDRRRNVLHMHKGDLLHVNILRSLL